MKLWQKVIIGLFFGILLGVLLKENAIYIKPIGDLFIKLIRMIISPLIFFAVVGGILNMDDKNKLGRVGLKAGAVYLITTVFAILIGFLTAHIIKPGVGALLDFSQKPKTTKIPKLDAVMDSLLSIIPDNAIGALAGSNMVQVLFFAVFTGVVVHKLDDPVHKMRFKNIFQMMSSLVFKMVSLIVCMSPYAAMAFTAWIIGTQGFCVLMNLGKLILSMLCACGAQYIIFGLIIFIWGRLKPWPFYKKSLDYQSLAFSTSSSKAALATAMNICQNSLGVSKSTSSFVLPLGVSINMDGMAIYLGLCAIFFAQAVGKTLMLHDYLIIMVTSTIGCIGGSGIPGGSIMMLPMILGSVNLPIEGVALIAGVDRILDMIRSTLNITGDVMVTMLVDRSEGKLNEAIYYSNQQEFDQDIA
jgi:Na+/H+-dicarboxylate symporter